MNFPVVHLTEQNKHSSMGPQISVIFIYFVTMLKKRTSMLRRKFFSCDQFCNFWPCFQMFRFVLGVYSSVRREKSMCNVSIIWLDFFLALFLNVSVCFRCIFINKTGKKHVQCFQYLARFFSGGAISCTTAFLTSSPTFSVRPRSSVSRVTVDLIRRSWV